MESPENESQKPGQIAIGFQIDEQKLWALELPVENIDISELDYNLNLPYLEQEGTDDWNLTPQMLLDNFNNEVSHAVKVEQSDLNYPIDIYFHQGHWIILDGVHRYVKALKEGRKTINVRRVPEALLQNIKRHEN